MAGGRDAPALECSSGGFIDLPLWRNAPALVEVLISPDGVFAARADGIQAAGGGQRTAPLQGSISRLTSRNKPRYKEQ